MAKFTDMKPKKARDYERWNDHLKHTRNLILYSTQRFDLLIIAICGAGIYIIFETLREFSVQSSPIDNGLLLKVSGTAFLIAIVANFLSQITGHRSNSYEQKYTYSVLSELEDTEVNLDQQDIHNYKSKRYSKWTTRLNVLSTLFMFVGLVLLVVFNFFLF